MGVHLKGKKMILSIVAALDERGLIGSGGALPWGRIPADMRRFVACTMGKPVIMGRKTHIAIGKELPGRLNIVITRSGVVSAPCLRVDALDAALALAGYAEEVCIIGGASVYEAALPLTTKLYLTRIEAVFEGDVYFPEVTWSEWRLLDSQHIRKGEGSEWPLRFELYERA